MRIIITGGTGFIGNALMQELNQKGHEIRCISRERTDGKKVGYIKGDIMEPTSYKNELINFKPDKIIHLAWHGLPNYSESYCKLNYEATLDLFEVIQITDCKEVISTGSCWEYEDGQGRVRENSKLNMSNSFAYYKNKTRIDGSKILEGANINLTWVRPFFIYGGKQRKTSLIPSCYKAIKENQVPEIRNPDAINDYIHIDDVVNGISCLVNSEKNNGIYNIGSGVGTSVWEIANIIALHIEAKSIFENRNSGVKGNFADNSKLRLKGWKPRISLNDGIRRVMEEFEES